ncbi:MAG: ATP-binding SpoIIE family protein phosphatase [Egibacteraceae bacterium]
MRGGPDDASGTSFWVAQRCAPNRWVLAVGDASGRQGRAALAGSEAVQAARSYHTGVTSAMQLLNRRFAPVSGDGHGTLGLVFAVLELDRCGAWVTIGSAGHPRPVLVRRAGWIDVRGQAGPPLGTAGGSGYGEDRVGLGPGDALVFTAGGVADARDAAGEAFSEERLPETLLAAVGQPAGVLAAEVLGAVSDHVGGDAPAEATVLVVRVPDDAADDPDKRLRSALPTLSADGALPGYPVGVPHWAPNQRPTPPREARILLPPAESSVPVGRRFARGVLHSWRLSDLAEVGDVELTTSELLGNAVRYGEDDITVLLGYDGTRVRVAVGDGSRLLPQSRPAGAFDVSGRGLPIVEALAAAVGVSPTVDGKRVWAEIDASR